MSTTVPSHPESQVGQGFSAVVLLPPRPSDSQYLTCWSRTSWHAAHVFVPNIGHSGRFFAESNSPRISISGVKPPFGECDNVSLLLPLNLLEGRLYSFCRTLYPSELLLSCSTELFVDWALHSQELTPGLTNGAAPVPPAEASGRSRVVCVA